VHRGEFFVTAFYKDIDGLASNMHLPRARGQLSPCSSKASHSQPRRCLDVRSP
jgi:hypothetical protein